MSVTSSMLILPPMAYDTTLWPRPCPIVAPNVLAICFEHQGRLFIPFLASLRPRRGFVARYLDALPTEQDVIFPEVMSAVLEAALKRRGFHTTIGYAPAYQEHTHCLMREKETKANGQENNHL